MTYGELIRELWRQSGKDKTAYADAVGYSRPQMTDILNERQPGSMKALRACLTHAKLTLFDCLAVPAKEPSAKEEKEALRLFQSLTGSKRDHALEYLRIVSGRQPATRKQRRTET